MPTLPNGRAASAALAACLALGLGTASAATAATGKDGRASKQAKKHVVKRAKRTGGTILSGAKAPGAKLGSVGDLYLRTSDDTLYGPKTRRGWGRPRSLVGPQGRQGAPGANGANGAQGPAGTPAFASGVVTNVGTTALTGTYDVGGELVSTPAVAGSVTVPAGISLVQLRLRAVAGENFAASGGGVACDVSTNSVWAVGAFATGNPLAADQIGWMVQSQPVTLPVNCSISADDGGTPGTTVSATVTGTQFIVFATNVPAV